MNRKTKTRLEKLESKAPEQVVRTLCFKVDELDPAREAKVAAFIRDNEMIEQDRLILRVIVDPSVQGRPAQA